ncbi:MAG: YdcF family protein [Abitibacteriaceae bacterium]|nr:YdcF family protein [Abditibacteriaceae bacterium]MBV9867875.1 YdcF family protein [Abditibacteriaceae bacterium]
MPSNEQQPQLKSPSARRTASPRKLTVTQRRARFVGGGLLLVLAGFCGVGGYLDGYGQHDHPQPAHAIVILGAHVKEHGVPGDALRRRTLHAVELYQQGLAHKIICTGGIGINPPAEAQVAAQLAMQQGVPESDLVLEDQSTSTWENASNATHICKAHGWQSIILVSDPYHMWRAQRDFKMLGLTVYPSPARNASLFHRVWGTSREVVVVMRDLIVKPRRV